MGEKTQDGGVFPGKCLRKMKNQSSSSNTPCWAFRPPTVSGNIWTGVGTSGQVWEHLDGCAHRETISLWADVPFTSMLPPPLGRVPSE